MSGREDYLAYHESSEELSLADEWDNLPEECKFCLQLGALNTCKLKKDDQNTCPLNDLECKQCQFYCLVFNKEGELMDYGFCSEREIQITNDEMACQRFKEYEGNYQYE